MTACRLDPSIDHDTLPLTGARTLRTGRSEPLLLVPCPGCRTDVVRAAPGRCDKCDEASHEGYPCDVAWMATTSSSEARRTVELTRLHVKRVMERVRMQAGGGAA